MKQGATLIAEERNRQIIEENYTQEDDLEYVNNELEKAAMCYIATFRMNTELQNGLKTPTDWPWSLSAWKPTPSDRIRELVKAGALIAAAIDRLLYEKETLDTFEKINRHFETNNSLTISRDDWNRIMKKCER